MSYAIANIKRAAAHIRATNAPVTISALARHMQTDYRKLYYFISHISGLKEELGVVTTYQHCKYTQAVDILVQGGLVVTKRRVALLTQSSPRAVQTWMRRYPTSEQVQRIICESQARRDRLIQRVLWIRKTKLGKRLNKSQLANLCGYERSSFLRVIKETPQLRAMITHA